MTTTLDPRLSDDELARAARARLAEARGLEDYERSVARNRTHEVLLHEAYVRGRVKLEQVFEELFLPPEDEPELADWFEGSTKHFASYREVLAGLAHPEAEVRKRAAQYLEKRGREEWGMADSLALADPRVMRRLAAAAGDPEPEVQVAALEALDVIVPRTKFYDPRLFQRVLDVHAAATTAAVRRWAALVLMGFDDPRRWSPLLDAFSERRLDARARTLLALAVGLGPRDAPEPIARALTEHLFSLLSSEKKPQLRSRYVDALGDIADPASIPRLRREAAGARQELVDDVVHKIEARAAKPG
jgi:hypothetical protein